MLEWFRMYTEARTDAKLCILTDAEHRVWFNLLCFAAAQEGESRGGIYGFDDELLAVEICGGDTERLRATIERLKKLRILKEDESGLTFCAFEKRQYDKPSDKPERVKQRVAAFRARNKQKSNAHVTPSNAIDSDADADADSDTESDSLSSGKDSSPVADDAENARVSSAAAAVNVSQQWTPAELKRVSKRISGRLKIVNPNLDDLMAILAQYPCAPPYLEAEAAKCAEWYGSKRRKIDIRLYDNWLAKAEQRRRQDSTPLAQTSQSMNGHHNNGNEAGMNGNGTTESARRAALAREAALDDERARQGAEMVRELAKLQTGG